MIPMLHKTDYKFFKKAARVASISDFKKTHLGCVAVYNGVAIGAGFNTNKTHPMQKHYNQYRYEKIETEPNNNVDDFAPKLHAEINCLCQIRHQNVDFSKVKLYIFRSSADKDLALSRPCPSCMAAIKDLGIKHIYYTTDGGFAYEKVG